MSAEAWSQLDTELDEWARAGRTAGLWWRDDDAVEPTPALDRMLSLSRRYQAPLALAVIPAKTGPDLVQQLRPFETVHVLQHGYAHINHAPQGEKASEFGANRNVEQCLEEISAGWRRLSDFKRREPIFVPPWNRIDRSLVPRLGELGFEAVSLFGGRNAEAAANVLEVNCHCDIIKWRTTRRFTGEDKALSELVKHLRARRLSSAASDEPTGLLTHHLQHDEESWDFLEALLHRLRGHDTAHWMTPEEALAA